MVALITSTTLVGAFVAPAGAAEGGRGTGDTSITGASVRIADGSGAEAVAVDLVDFDSLATRDADRVDSASIDLARGALSLADVSLVDDFVQQSIPPSAIAVERSENNPGSADESYGSVRIEIPGDGVDFPDDAGRADDVIDAADLAFDRSGVIGLVNGLAGSDATSVGDGDVLSGSVEPRDLLAVFSDVEAAFSGGTRIADASTLGGLIDLSGLGVAEQESWSEVAQSGAAVRGASLDRLTVLDLEATLGLFGLSISDIPLGTLVALADELGLDLSGAVGDLDLDAFDTWEDLRAQLDDARDELQSTLDAGGTCDSLTSPIDDLLGEADLSCDDVEQALDDVDGLIDDLEDAVGGVLSGAALLSVEDLKAEVQAVASVDENAVALTSASATGSIGAVKVGGVTLGAFSADLTESPLSSLQATWAELKDKVHEQLDSVLGVLGEDYEELITVQAVPVLVQETGIDGQYATADAAISLLRVVVTLPDSLPDPVDVAEGLAGDDDDTGGTTTTTTPLLPGVTTTIPPVTTTSIDLLEISNVRSAGAALGQVAPLGSSVTIEVGTLAASAEHTRDVEITGGGENRTFDGRFGAPGSIPRTGGTANVFVMLFAATLVGAGWYGRRLLAATAPQH